jgi:hypothetical protein
MLYEGRLEEKLQEPYYYGWSGRGRRMRISQDGSLGCPYIEFGVRTRYKEEVPPTEGSRALLV